MIVGTSTGALIAFALVGGKLDNGARTTMDCDEIIKMYIDLSPKIFPKGGIIQPGSYIKRWLMPGAPPMWTYDTTDYIKVLKHHFGNSTLSDFPEGCKAGTEKSTYMKCNFFDSTTYFRSCC